MKPLPENVELMREVSAARWVADGLRPWGKRRIEVTSIVPQGFEAYARVPHAGQPDFGEGIPIDQLSAIKDVLTGFTSTPDSCWICIWAGYGFWSSGSFGISVLAHPGKEAEAERAEAEFRRIMAEREARLDGVPEAEVGGESYYLFHGPIAHVDTLAFVDESPESPNIWWPDDRAWCVGGGIDLPTTFVGGSRECIDAVVATQGLDVSEVAPDDDVNERPPAGR